MEKQRIKSITEFSRRLLSFFFILSISSIVNLSAQQKNVQQDSFIISPSQDQNLYTQQDIKFEVLLPGTRPAQVQLKSPIKQQNVVFKSFRKIDDYETNGTILELWLNFEKKGEYKLSPLSIAVKNKRKNIYFENITIKENPANLIPRIAVIFENGYEIFSDETNADVDFTYPTGKKLTFTVNLQYAVQLVQFNWDLPTDAILHQTKTYDITEVKYREKNYTEDLIPVASYEWTVLKSDRATLPKFHFTATGYNGHKYDLTTPNFSINFTAQDKIDSLFTQEDSTFDEAFQVSQTSSNKKQIEITEAHCTMLAFLRNNEKKAVFNHSALVKERQDYENYLNLPYGEKEFSNVSYFLSGLLIVIFIIFLIIVIMKKRIFAICIFSILLVASIVFNISTLVQKNKTYAISLGTSVKSIPDEKASSSQLVVAGARVQVTESADEWSYIELGNICGWCKSDSLIIIK